ncbi:DUF1491 family protein [Celeribacter marinus]|uniref:ATP-dependent Zn protease n=1 Tax=Celeribacter marinus TaxID=1397108 RepID=A0A0P0AB78_9RHOB|nr:DUF1491 family protein [Celeribacter marinus]ALI55467.1 ATP-dependent Zn protease [Celeribacter marinus]SFK19806.1 hypothetical protein SAMN05444421_10273 [Celeribacter marinus]
MARLTADFWVSAYLSRLRLADIPAFVVKKGDATAGAILIKLNTLDGQATAFQREFNLMEDRREWQVLTQGDERDVDATLTKQRSFDADVWIIEVEDRHGRTLLDEVGLSD